MNFQLFGTEKAPTLLLIPGLGVSYEIFLPLIRLTHTELSGVTALDFMVEHLSDSPLTDAARASLRPQVKELIEEPTTRGFRIKLIV